MKKDESSESKQERVPRLGVPLAKTATNVLSIVNQEDWFTLLQYW